MGSKELGLEVSFGNGFCDANVVISNTLDVLEGLDFFCGRGLDMQFVLLLACWCGGDSHPILF